MLKCTNKREWSKEDEIPVFKVNRIWFKRSKRVQELCVKNEILEQQLIFEWLEDDLARPPVLRDKTVV